MMPARAARVDELEFSDIDLEFGRFLARLGHCDRPEFLAAAALASRATASGDVCVQLSDFAEYALPVLDLTAPELSSWMASLRACPVIGAPGEFRPLVLDQKGRLYLYRYWDYEKRLADNVLARALDADDVDERLLRKGLKRYFPDERDVEQKLAAATAVLRRFAVISGGPGTGKTTTVVKIIALLAEQAGARKLAVALAAPTGKAAARVQDAMRGALTRLDLDLFTRDSMPAEAVTIHRLLGARRESISYRHGPGNPLPLDVLIVDEASMADLALAVRLLEALPARTRVILLGDKDQLASVEAGAVLADICRRSGYSTRFAKRLASLTGVAAGKIAMAGADAPALSDSVALLERSYRFGPESGIGNLARLVNAGRGDEALEFAASAGHSDIAWHSVSPSELRRRIATVIERLRGYFDAVRASESPLRIFERFNEFRVLCARRSGRFGATGVNRTIEELLDEKRLVDTRDTWYAGRPVMITRNDYNLRLFNGDVGITLPDPEAGERLKVFFFSGSEGLRRISPARLPEHETVYAMTVHKSQGSEFAEVLLVLPNELSPIMSRELIYTGVTRAMRRVELWGTDTVFVEAVKQVLTRASALAERLWGDSPHRPEAHRAGS
jgi:exodeoxyribonuclease V alpha subunit